MGGPLNSDEPRVVINLAAQPTHVCECGSVLYMRAHILKYVPRFMSPTGEDTLVPLDMSVCVKCARPAKVNDADQMNAIKKSDLN